MRSVSPARRGLPADEPADDRGAAVLEPGPPAAGQGARARGQHAGLQTHGLPARRRPPLDLTYIHTYIHTLRILPVTTVPVVRHVIFDEAKKRYASRTDSFRFSEVRATDLDDLTARCRHCVLDPKPGASVRATLAIDASYIPVCMYVCMYLL